MSGDTIRGRTWASVQRGGVCARWCCVLSLFGSPLPGCDGSSDDTMEQRPQAAEGGRTVRGRGASPAKDAAASASPSGCAPRKVEGEPGVRFHHVHFNTTDPMADLRFFETFFDASSVELCRGDDAASATLATRTERGYFLYTKVDEAPDPTLNTYLEHVGWIHPDPNGELQRLVMLGAPRFPVGRGQCDTAFMGTMACNNYWFYLMAPSGAKIEVARGPGPAVRGFGHVHMVMGTDFEFFALATGGALRDKAIDLVNHTDVAIEESNLDGEEIVETRGKPIDHLGYSTTDLDAERQRVLDAGLEIVEDTSFKPEYGFRSFFMKSPQGIWIEMVEDSPFDAAP